MNRLLAILALTLAACGGGATAEVTSPTEAPAETTTEAPVETTTEASPETTAEASVADGAEIPDALADAATSYAESFAEGDVVAAYALFSDECQRAFTATDLNTSRVLLEAQLPEGEELAASDIEVDIMPAASGGFLVANTIVSDGLDIFRGDPAEWRLIGDEWRRGCL